MCGINGIVSPDQSKATALIQTMNEALHHRGPDSQGVYQDDSIALGHTRLKIIDLSWNSSVSKIRFKSEKIQNNCR